MLLERMNKGFSKIVIQIFAVLLIASFGIWGIGDMTGIISNPDSVATVDGSKITQNEFQDQFSREMERLRQRVGEIDMEQARSLGLAHSTLNGMISRRLLATQADDLGLMIGDDEIVRHIQQEPAFRNKLGHFDRSVYKNVLANNGLSEKMYVASLRHDIQQDYLARAISRGVATPDTLAETIYKYRNERREAEVVTVARAPLDKAPQPTDAQLSKYLDDHSEKFMAPEYRRLAVLHLDPDKVAKELSPSPERIKEEYEYRLPSLSVPERRRLEQMLFKDEDKARKAYAELKEGRTFEAVAKNVAGKSPDDIKLGLVTKDDLLPQLEGPVFALNKGAFTEPLKSPLGWHIIRVVDINPGHKPSLDEVRKKISDDLAHEMALDDLVKEANKVEDAMAGGATMEEAANEVGSSVRELDPISADAKLQSGTPMGGLPQKSKFIEKAFSLQKGQTSRLTETDDGGYFMVRVDDIIPPKKRSLDQVHDAVARAWKTEKLNAAAKKTAEAVRDAAKGGKELGKIASDRNVPLETGKPFTRFASASDTFVPLALIPALFDAKKGDVVMAQTDDGYAVGRLTGILEHKPAADDEEYKNLKNNLSSAMANDLLQEYTAALRKEYSVSINESALDAFFANRAR